MDYHARQQRLLQLLEQNKLDALLVTHPPNVRYLCGFSGSAGVLIVNGPSPVFFTDGRYTQQAAEQVQTARVIVGRHPPLLSTAGWLGRAKNRGRWRALGIESEHMTVAARSNLEALLPAKMRLHPTAGLIEQLRMIKDALEIAAIREAVRLGGRLFERALEVVRAGVTEAQVAAEMEYLARHAGAEGMSFPTIVASGPRSAHPHGRASAEPISAGGFVVLDFGVILAGYCSDMTRTLYVGRPSRAARGMYNAVREAQGAALEAVRPGIAVGEVDRAARSVLRRGGLARYFTHSTGHGVGLEIHESPRLGAGQKAVLQPGMVITVEPGIYLPGKGGIRIEDMVVVSEGGCQVLTPSTKELIAV